MCYARFFLEKIITEEENVLQNQNLNFLKKIYIIFSKKTFFVKNLWYNIDIKFNNFFVGKEKNSNAYNYLARLVPSLYLVVGFFYLKEEKWQYTD